MEYNVKILFGSSDNWENRILLINEKENNFQLKKEMNHDNKQIKTYKLLNASIINNHKNELDNENSIFIGTALYNMTMKPNNEEDNKYIIKSFNKMINNIKNLEKDEKDIKEEKEDSNKCFEKLSK